MRLTRDLVETYRICNTQFKYRGELNPKRYLTTPSVGVLNDGFDNVNSDLILAVNDDFCSSDSRQRFAIVLFIFKRYCSFFCYDVRGINFETLSINKIRLFD